MKKGQNVRGLTSISYKTYRKLRAFKYPAITFDGKRMISATCYKDGHRVKFCGWMGGYNEWENYAKSLGLKKGVHYVDETAESWRGPYPVTILYVKE